MVTTNEKKTSKPAPLLRKTTPQYVTKSGSAWNNTNTSRRDRDRERDDEDRGRDSGESFPQFCMSCEKQFLPANNTFLYCSESCRLHDQAPSPAHANRTHSYPSYPPTSPPLTPYTRHFSSYAVPSHEEGPDIIPRFSPTQSRPRSYFNSDPYPQTNQEPSHISTSPPPTHGYTNSHSSTALASLRELATALPKTSGRPESPPKSSASSINRPTSGVWNYIPFTSGSKTSSPTQSVTPGNSYTNSSTVPSYNVSQSYNPYNTSSGNGYARSKEDLYAYGKSHGNAPAAPGYYGTTGGMGMDRPLPPRSGPSGYGHRPRSIDLVTPYSGAH